MHATKVEPGPGRRSRMLLAGGVAAAAILTALVVVLVQSRDDAAPATGEPPAAQAAQTPTAEEVATGFLQALGAFDVEKASTYLADGAAIASMTGHDDLRLLVGWLDATGYEQTLGPCEEIGASGSGQVRCPFDFHALRSAEIGRGPFTGSSFDVVVSDGKVVRAKQGWEIAEFSPQMWEPFRDWVVASHPKDAAVMYVDDGGNVRLTEESIQLWEQNTERYVDEVKRNRQSVRRASSVRSG